MITQIRGRLVEKNPTYVVVDCAGVGYLLHVSLQTFSSLPTDENIVVSALFNSSAGMIVPVT